MDKGQSKRGRPPAPETPFVLPTNYMGFNIVRLAHLKRQRDDSLLKAELGIGLMQFGLLLLLEGQPGLGAGQLARWLLITPQSTAPLLSELEGMGLIERAKDRRRGSRVELNLSDGGRALLDAGRPLLAQIEAETRRALTADEAALFHALLIRVAQGYVELAQTDPPARPDALKHG